MQTYEKLTALADAIREKTGGADKLTLDDMAAAIDDVHAAGAKSEYERFWDEYQQSGGRTQYLYAFSGSGWKAATFLPKYPMYLAGSTGGTFSYCGLKDLKAHMEANGIVLDTSKATILEMFFRGSTITTYGTLDCTSCTNLNYLLHGANYLKSIDKVIIKDDGSQTCTNFANNCRELVDITIEGTFGDSVSFQWSTKLSRASIESIMGALSDTTDGLSLTLSETARANAFTDEEWETLLAEKPNWTINLI